MTTELEDLLVSGLKQLYHTEQRLVDALTELEETSTRDELKTAFAKHREETEGHIERLHEVFEEIGMEPEGEEDKVIEAMIAAHEEFVKSDPSDDAINRYNIAAGQKAEHYEIAAYGNLTPIADALGHDNIPDILEENMREEQDELDSLSEMGEQFDQQQIEA